MPTKSVNTFLSGLNLSIDSINQPKDTYSYALNTIKEDSVNNPEILSNEKGFTTYIDLGYDYLLLGVVYLGKKDYVYLIKNLDSDLNIFNRIILVQDTTISTILDNVNLNFNSNNTIKGTYRINFKNERIIYWVDGFNDDRVLNIDNNNITDISELSLDIKYIPAILTGKVINDDNGNLLTGSYEFFASYKTQDNAVTPWFILNAKPIYIIEANTQNLATSQYINVDGTDSGIVSNKSIELDISNLDPNFEILRIGILKTIKGNTTGYFIDNISYNSITKKLTYNGFDTEILVPNIADFTTDIVRYYGSNAIIQSNNRLVRANLKADKIDIDYQALANNIIVDYYVDEDLVLTMPDSTDYTVRSNWWREAATKYTDEQTLMRDETYSLGIAFGLIKEGIETEVYHIPGRQLNNIPISIYESEFKDVSSVSYTTTWDSVTVSDNGDNVPRWTVQNTGAKSIDGRIHKLAYYESTNVYPDGFNFPLTGSTNNGVNNTNVRHHKIPSSNIEPIYRTDEFGGNFNIYKRNIGLTFSNIEVPTSIKGNISYIRIYITPRNSSENKSILAKGIFTNCCYTRIYSFGDQTHTPTDAYWIAPCQPYNDLLEEMNNLRYQEFGVNDDGDTNTTNNHYHSFYSPDTLLKNPNINANRVYIENELTGIVHYYNTTAPNIQVDPAKPSGSLTNNAINGGYKRDLFYSLDGKLVPTIVSTSVSGDVYNIANVFKTTYKSIALLNQISKVSTGKVSKKAKKAVYVPFNAQLSPDQLGGMDNPYYSPLGAANILVELDPNNSVLGATENVDTSVEFIDNNSAFNNLERTADHGLTTTGTFHFHTIPSPQVVYRYGSIKQTNPTQYGDIAGLNYIPTDLVLANPTFDINNKLTISMSGLIGDSYIDLFSVKRTRFGAKEGYTYAGLPEVSVGISSFFTESQTNLRLRYAEGTSAEKNYYPKVLLSTSPTLYLDYSSNPAIVLSDNYYKENSDFDTISEKENFGRDLIDIQTAGIIDYSTRLVYSEQLANETVSDSYRVFLANNYLDLTKNTGFISHLFNKQQELYAVTRDSLWRLFTSSQTIKVDSSENVTVGTGEFLSNQPIEILSIDGGYAGSSSKGSLVETPYGYFYCDRYKGRFILFDGQPKDIAIKGVNQFTKDNFTIEILQQIKALDTDFDSPLLNYGYIAGYEPENNRILLTKLDYKFTEESFSSYKGLYNPETTYTIGDIYLRDGILYTFTSTNTEYTTIEESSDLSDFINSTVSPIVFSLSSPSHGTAVISPTDNTQVLYTPTDNYIGSDSFNITVGCTTTEVDLSIQNAPTTPNYTDSIVEFTSDSTVVQTIVGTYASHSLTYYILSGNTYNVFSLDPTTGILIVNDNTFLNYDLVTQFILSILTLADDSKRAFSTVTVNVTREVEEPTHPDETVVIDPTTPVDTVIYTISQASYPYPPSPYSELIYNIVSESNPGIFSYNLVDPSAMTISVAEVLPDSPTTFTIVVNATDNMDSSQTVNFTITIEDALYFNTRQHQVFTKDDCGEGLSGTAIDYVVPANTYTSIISQMDADGKALADITANGQDYANTHGSCVISTLIGTLLIDFQSETTLDVCAYCTTSGVTEQNIIVASTDNGGPLQYPNDGRDPATCSLLSSDKLAGPPVRRFGVNMAYFITQYPAIDHFTFVVKGRANAAEALTGSYALRDATEGHLTLGVYSSGPPPLYIPGVSSGSSSPITFGTNVVAGANGAVGTAVGELILTLDYIVSTNTLTATTY